MEEIICSGHGPKVIKLNKHLKQFLVNIKPRNICGRGN